ncbi:MAG: hypothetical protein HQ567_28330 [Candidatus Nealsonbacteria bacterium]|nr:hypothetical protein [Candidatus Nealsonbacteria bacterium]
MDSRRAVVGLTQRCEEALRRKLQRNHHSPEDLATMVKEVALSPENQPYIEQVHSVRLIAEIIEVEFSAVGYPERYVSYVGVDGTGGRYKLRTVARPILVMASRCEWVQSPDGTVCVAEAMDKQGQVIARARVSLEHQDEQDLVPYRGEGGIRAVEETTMNMVRTFVLLQKH